MGHRARVKNGSRFLVRNDLQFESLESRFMLSGSPVVTKVEVASTSWSSAFLQSLNGPNSTATGYSIPLGSTAQSATLTWDNIDRIILTFNKDVIVDVHDFSLSG